MEEGDRLQSMGSQSDMTERFHIIHYIYLRYTVHKSIKYVIDIIVSIIDTTKIHKKIPK